MYFIFFFILLPNQSFLERLYPKRWSKNLSSALFNDGQQLDGTCNVFWDFGSNGEDISFGVESRGIGTVCNLNWGTFGADVREFSGNFDFFGITSDILQFSGFAGDDFVAGFVGIVESINIDGGIGAEEGGVFVGNGDGDQAGDNELLNT